MAASVAVALVLAAGYFGLTQKMGAHPFWAFKVTWIGAPIGAAVFLAIAGRWQGRLVDLTLIVLLGLSALATYWGKTEFAASYAENALAGQFWFYGWIAISVFVTAAIAWVDWKMVRPRRK